MEVSTAVNGVPITVGDSAGVTDSAAGVSVVGEPDGEAVAVVAVGDGLVGGMGVLVKGGRRMMGVGL